MCKYHHLLTQLCSCDEVRKRSESGSIEEATVVVKNSGDIRRFCNENILEVRKSSQWKVHWIGVPDFEL